MGIPHHAKGYKPPSCLGDFYGLGEWSRLEWPLVVGVAERLHQP